MTEMKESGDERSPTETSAASTSWHLSTGPSSDSEWTTIVVPHAGTLSVVYDWTTKPADQIWVRSTLGLDTPIERGMNTFAVDDGAMIMYRIVDRDNAIKLFFSIL